ncbi:MAG: thioredoxin family protein [Actinomycetota bacterium]|nr:thioredoxin family protein [Actinomycetota bacterium]
MDGAALFGVIALAAVLVTVAIIAMLRGRYDGRVRTTAPRTDPWSTVPGGLRQNRQEDGPAARPGVLPVLADLGIALPDGHITVVQFSGEFCAACPQARTLVERVLLDHPDIAHVELDVAEHLHAVRALEIRRTPTLLILDKQGRPVHRVSGLPREGELRLAVSELAGSR